MSALQLVAIDARGGQAVVSEGKSFFLVSMDRGWEWIPLEDRADALRAMQFGLYEHRGEVFPDRESLTESARSECLRVIPVPVIAYDEIKHLLDESSGEYGHLITGTRSHRLSILHPLEAAMATSGRHDEPSGVSEAIVWQRLCDYVAKGLPPRKLAGFVDPEDVVARAICAVVARYRPSRTSSLANYESQIREHLARSEIQHLPGLARRGASVHFYRWAQTHDSRSDSTPGPLADMIDSEQMAMLAAALSRLTVRELAVITAILHGHSSADTARALGLTLRQVRMVRTRAILRLRNVLAVD